MSDLEQMENIVNQFLAYARRSNEEQVMVNFSEAVQTAIHNARIDADPTMEVTTQLAPDVFVMAHPLELSRAVQNLIVNAQRYGRSDDGKLRLTMTVKKSADNQTAELDVADQGTGLPESQRARVPAAASQDRALVWPSSTALSVVPAAQLCWATHCRTGSLLKSSSR